jgi:hypothetical protein
MVSKGKVRSRARGVKRKGLASQRESVKGKGVAKGKQRAVKGKGCEAQGAG